MTTFGLQSVESKVSRRIRSTGRGAVVTPAHFADLGSPAAIRKALQSLTDLGKIRRLAQGIYDYPKRHPRLGLLSPSADDVANALARRDQIKLQPGGAHAANLLGLTLQVPAQVVYLTDGKGRDIQIGKQRLTLKRTTPRHVAAAGRISGLVIQALRYWGQAHVDDAVIQKLDQRLTDADRRVLLKDIGLAPAWIQKIIRRLAQPDGAR